MDKAIKKIESIEELSAFCKKKGFIFRAGEIYGGLSGFFDFGPLGCELKNNIKNLYINRFVHKREDMTMQDGSIITNPKVWKASGHVDNFADLLLTTKQTKTKIRADHFIEDVLNINADGLKAKDIQELISKHNLKYKGEDFEDVKDFNLMFSTQIGASSEKGATGYLRPETCQSIFPNFKLLADVSRSKLPFGIVQIGKAFRNEISPRDFIFRCREFEQIEMEYFYNPKSEFDMLKPEDLNVKFNFLSAQTQDKGLKEMETITINDLISSGKVNKIHGYWLSKFIDFFMNDMGFAFDDIRVREHVKTELSHYSSATVDIDYKYPFGFKEMMGIANRADYDLSQHQLHSSVKLEFFDETTQTKLIPNCIEPSIGVERLFLATICNSYNNDEKRGNIVLNLPEILAPYKVAVFPLMNKPELIELSRSIFKEILQEDIFAIYDKSGSIGRRYARADEMGVPYCLTIDYSAIEDGAKKGFVTIRDIKSTEQKLIKIQDIADIIRLLIRGKIKFNEL